MATLGNKMREAMGVEKKETEPIKQTEEQKKAIRDYWERVKAKRQGMPDKLHAPSVFKKFKEIANEELNLFGKQLYLDENNHDLIKMLSIYLSRDEENMERYFPSYSINKGLLITGKCGTGKSFIIRNYRNVLKKVPGFSFGFVSTNEVVAKYNEGGAEEIAKYKEGFQAFDDLGSELMGNHYGKEEVFKTILEERYNRFISFQDRTIATSNLTLSAIHQRYGDRVGSRLKEMFNIIDLGGDDRRC